MWGNSEEHRAVGLEPAHGRRKEMDALVLKREDV